MKFNLLCIIGLVLLGCKSEHMSLQNIDIQGHRGCRGLLPENTIPGFIKALDLGVTTLELDLSINGDGNVIVSHEPFFNHEISTGPDGELISKEEELSHNVFTLSQKEIENYDVGMRPHPRFVLQKKMAATKPSLTDMIAACEDHAKKNNYPTPLYNMEIKRRPEGDKVYHPEMSVFADKVIKTIQGAGVMDRSTVQCFDVETLQYVHKTYPDVSLVYLIENKNSPSENLKLLGFIPKIYSPYFELIDKELVDLCKENKMKLIPWTVNKAEDVEKLIAIGVDGIISDYPDMVVEVVASLKEK